MTDVELIARLRDLGFNLTDAAADRIEALTEQLAAARNDAKEAEAYAEELEADRRKTYEALLKVSRIHGEVEAKLTLMTTERDEAWKRAAHSEKMWGEAEVKLAKAAEALEFYAWENEIRLPSDGPWGAGSTDFGKVARATLAEIKGESHD